MLPFDSSFFFTDPFFGGVSCGIQNKTVTVIVFDQLSPANQGKLLGRPGDWGQFYFKVSDVTKPQPSDTFTIGDVTWRVDSADAKGDIYEVLAESKMRMHR